MIISFLVFLSLVLVPLFSAWWIFFLLCLLAVFIWDSPLAGITAGFFLDSLFFAPLGKMPILTIYSTAVFFIFYFFRDKLRV